MLFKKKRFFRSNENWKGIEMNMSSFSTNIQFTKDALIKGTISKPNPSIFIIFKFLLLLNEQPINEALEFVLKNMIKYFESIPEKEQLINLRLLLYDKGNKLYSFGDKSNT